MLACNLTLDDIRRLKESTIRLNNDLIRSIDVLKQIITSVKVLTT